MRIHESTLPVGILSLVPAFVSPGTMVSGKTIVVSAGRSVVANHASCLVPEPVPLRGPQRRLNLMDVLARLVAVQVALATINQMVAIAQSVSLPHAGPLLDHVFSSGVAVFGEWIIDSLAVLVEVKKPRLVGLRVPQLVDSGVFAAGMTANVDNCLEALIIRRLLVLLLP